MLYATRPTGNADLLDILRMQKLYLRGQTSPREESEQGFLTVAHDLEMLVLMDQLEPSVIVKDDETLAGYALVMPKTCAAIIPVLLPMFEILNQLVYQGKLINEYNYYVMGQVCVDKAYRGKGVFEMLYKEHRHRFQSSYDFVISEISTRNKRSLRAHEKTGFRPIHIYRDETDEWAVVIWDWS